MQEDDRVPLGRALLVALLSVLVSAGAVGVSVLISGARPHASAVALPSPSMTSMPEQSLIERTARGKRLREAQRAELDKYEWIDRDAGLVSIPVERAIDLAADGGP